MFRNGFLDDADKLIDLVVKFFFSKDWLSGGVLLEAFVQGVVQFLVINLAKVARRRGRGAGYRELQNGNDWEVICTWGASRRVDVAFNYGVSFVVQACGNCRVVTHGNERIG